PAQFRLEPRSTDSRVDREIHAEITAGGHADALRLHARGPEISRRDEVPAGLEANAVGANFRRVHPRVRAVPLEQEGCALRRRVAWVADAADRADRAAGDLAVEPSRRLCGRRRG